MKISRVTNLVAFLILIIVSAASAERLLVCYSSNWAQYRPNDGKFVPESIDPFLCTHIIHAFAKVNNEGEIMPYEWNDENTEWSKGLYQKTIDLKIQNPELKVLLAVGGWNHGSGPFSQMASREITRGRFIQNSISYLIKHKFDGLDLDWEYPGGREGSMPTDKIYFTKLVKEMKIEFDKNKLILTAAVAGGKNYIDTGYEVSEITKYFDFVNVMTYDLHGSWNNYIGHHAPLYPKKDETGDDRYLNIDWVVKYWLSKGLSKDKLVLGLPAYGRTFTLETSYDYKFRTKAISGGTAGKYTKEKGFLSYYEICDNLKKGWKRKWDDESKSPYAYKNNEWVGYDDIESMKIKAKYIVDNDLAGAMFWAIDIDDFSGTHCHEGNFPLTNTVKKYFSENKYPARTKESNTTKDQQNVIDYQNINEKLEKEFSLLMDSSIYQKNSFQIPTTTYQAYTQAPFKIPIRIPTATAMSTSILIQNTPQKLVSDLVVDNKKISEFELADPAMKNFRQSDLQIHNLKASIIRKMTRLLKSKENGFRDDFVCQADGNFADKTSGCIVFYNCLWVNTPWSKKFKNICPEKTIFNSKYQICDWEDKVVCE